MRSETLTCVTWICMLKKIKNNKKLRKGQKLICRLFSTVTMSKKLTNITLSGSQITLSVFVRRMQVQEERSLNLHKTGLFHIF